MIISWLWMLLWAASVQAYWMEDIPHRGRAPFNPDPNYTVFRNVKDYGAVGDGVTDDTAAINRAISSGNRCGPGFCKGNTVTPAVIYFPPGTYIISNSIINYFYTQIIGDPTNLPVIKATANFPTSTTFGLLDGNQYQPGGALAWVSTNVFFRQVRNLIFDTTAIPPGSNAVGIHWPSSQATSITNCVFRLSQATGNQHVGLFIEEGSGGLLNDLVFYGGRYGARLGNQQYTARNLTFYNAGVAAINQLWDWGWTYKSLTVQNCPVGIDVLDTVTGSITLLDSQFTDVDTAVRAVRVSGVTVPSAAGSLILDNVAFTRVRNVLVNPQAVLVPGNSAGTVVSDGFVMGNIYSPTGPISFQGSESSFFPRPPALLSGGKFYERSKPHYENVPASSFLSARTFGATGDGRTDDTAALNRLFAASASNNQIAFVDAGIYIVTDTVLIPPGARIVGEALSSIIMAAGPAFSQMSSPKAVVRVGSTSGQQGYVEWSDMMVATRGATAGAKLIEYNLATNGATPSGMWDVHVRVGGWAGTDLLLAQCPTTPSQTNYVNPNCIASWMSMHITPGATNLLMENNWLWIADHDLEDDAYRQITIFAGRGLYIESTEGKIWLSATGVEHHNLYNYQLVGTRDIYMAMPQTETPYYQPNPPANIPFPALEDWNDPDFVSSCAGVTLPGYCAMSWGLRILSSQNIVAYGLGLYSFFNNYSTNCAQPTTQVKCQARMVELINLSGASNIAGLHLYNLNTIGSTSMITRLGTDIARFSDNVSGFASTIVLYQHDS